MPEYAITVARSAAKEIASLPASVSVRVRGAIDGLAANPRPAGCKKLKDAQSRWRIRVGDHRIIYTINDQSASIDVERVRHRREVYR